MRLHPRYACSAVGAHARPCSWGGRLLALLVGICLIGVHPHHASANAPPPVKPGSMKPDSPATMLELDSEDAVLGRRLGHAMRRAFAQRGLDDGRRDSLAELRLAMGCTEDEPECLAKGGKTLGVKTLIYGRLETTKAGHVLDVSMLAVESAKVTSSVRLTLSAAELGESAIDRTAERVVADLLGEEVEPAAVVPPPAPPAPAPAATTSSVPPADITPTSPTPARKGKFWWGLETPTPKWKWALFGTSVALVTVSTASLIGTLVGLRKQEDELVETAYASLEDTYPEGHPMAGQPNEQNDVDPRLVDDICAAGREHPDDPVNPDSVRNKSVTEVCNRGDSLEKGVIASYALLGISLAATFAFTGVLLIHRSKPAARRAAARRLRVSFSPGPRGFGGAVSGRF